MPLNKLGGAWNSKLKQYSSSCGTPCWWLYSSTSQQQGVLSLIRLILATLLFSIAVVFFL